MVKYSFLVQIDETTVTTIIECGKEFLDCCNHLDYRLRFSCGFEKYKVLSVQSVL